MTTINVRDSYDLVLETHEEFIRIRSSIDRLMLPLAQCYGLTPIQVTVLNIIRKRRCVTVSELYKALDFNQGNMSSMCKKLEDSGFIKKKKCPEDERKCFLTLTDKAMAALSGIDEFFSVSEDDCWLSPEEIAEAEAAMEILKNTAIKVNQRLMILSPESEEN